MVNAFGYCIGGEAIGNFQMLRKVIVINGKYADYLNGIQASHKFGYPAYRIAPEGSTTFVITYANKVFCLGAHHQHLDERYLAYWKEDSSSGGNAASIKDDRGIQSKRGATGEAGLIDPSAPKGVTGDIGLLKELESREIEVVLDRLDRKEEGM